MKMTVTKHSHHPVDDTGGNIYESSGAGTKAHNYLYAASKVYRKRNYLRDG